MFGGIRGYDEFMKHYYRALAFDRSQKAKLRLEILEFFEQFGLSATRSAFGVSRATVYRWRQAYLADQKRLTSLIPASTRPKRVRKRLVDSKIIGFINNLRENYGRLGKDKLKPLVDEYCQAQGIETTSASTIGRVITDHNGFYQKQTRMYHNPNHGWAKPRKKIKRLRQRYAPRPSSFGYIEMDTLVKFVDGMKIYLITAIDVKLKFSFAQAYTRLNSQNAKDCLKKLQLVYPFNLHTIQTDNGLEFLGDFDKYLKKRQIKHLFIYPRCPRINGVVERFNRTLREDFLNRHLHLVRRPKLFHRKLMDYLLFFNTKRPHQSLGQKSPLGYALEKGYLSQMSWTSTLH